MTELMNRDLQQPHETGPCLEPLRRRIRSHLARLPWWLSEFCVAAIKVRFSVNQDETRAGV